MRVLLVHPSFCSAWTFYGRSCRKAGPEAAAEEPAGIAEPNVFTVDDVAFIRPEHGDAIAAELERRRVRKQYCPETRADLLPRHIEVFERWTRPALRSMGLGMQALDTEGLDLFRKRVSPDDDVRALETARKQETARKLGISVAVDLIVASAWGAERVRLVREFALSVPDIGHMTVMTPCPGTEIRHSKSRRLTTRAHRLFAIQHAVVPTTLPLERFHEELTRTQSVINGKHRGLHTALGAGRILGGRLAHGQTDFARMLWTFDRVHNAGRQLADHHRPVRYDLPLPPAAPVGDRRELYVRTRPVPRSSRPAGLPE
ncbi:hypothetical protein GCM10018787_48880 [Streptomyces thermodiastaticus]|nr:hypothetical protein GCM10018787_48880 [Streptomyces thermodiastaticus]